MRRCWQLILIVFAAGTVCHLPQDARAGGSPKVNTNPAAAKSYWTAEHFRDAKPLPMPVGRLANAMTGGPQLVPKARRGTDAPGAPPSMEGGKGLGLRLYELQEPEAALPTPPGAEDPGALRPKASATSGATFTNSRVFPSAAVRAFPNRAVGKLFLFDGLGDSTCTGTVVQRRLVLTAAHCVYDPESDFFFDHFTFVPAYDRGHAPFGRWDWRVVWTTTSWLTGDGSLPNNADFAIIKVADQTVDGRRVAIGDLTGWFGWNVFATPDGHLTGLGYPLNLDGGERLQQTQAEVFDVLSPNAIVFGSYQSLGASGGPVTRNYGQRAQGQPGSPNRIIGVTSFESLVDWIVGASMLNEEFLEIVDQACADVRRNCD